MTTRQDKPSGMGDWMGKIADLFGGADKNLDRVKKSVQADLDKLKKGTDTASNLYASAESGFKKDLEELGVRGDAQKEHLALFKAEWDRMEMSKQSTEILASPELAAMDGFITDIQNLPKLKAVIESAEPESNWQTMIKGFASHIPGLSQFLDGGGFDTILTSLGLGFLVKPKKDKPQPEGATAVAKQEEGKKKDETDKPEKKEAERKTPKSTIFIGDSITAFMEAQSRAQGDKNPLHIDGPTMSVAEKDMGAEWGIAQVEKLAKQNPSPLKNMENAVILFGTNDIGLGGPWETADKIFDRLEKIYQILTEAGVKHIYAVTVPPFGGYTAYDKRPDVNARREELNKMIRGEHPRRPKSQYIHHVIDTCKPESEGGLADNNDPNRFSKTANGDWLHPNKLELAKLYQRELEIGSNQTA